MTIDFAFVGGQDDNGFLLCHTVCCWCTLRFLYCSASFVSLVNEAMFLFVLCVPIGTMTISLVTPHECAYLITVWLSVSCVALLQFPITSRHPTSTTLPILFLALSCSAPMELVPFRLFPLELMSSCAEHLVDAPMHDSPAGEFVTWSLQLRHRCRSRSSSRDFLYQRKRC